MARNRRITDLKRALTTTPTAGPKRPMWHVLPGGERPVPSCDFHSITKHDPPTRTGWAYVPGVGGVFTFVD